MPKSDLLSILADVKFSSTRVDSSQITVKLHDHSGLGGPMGSERTSVIESWTFSNAGIAKTFTQLLIERLAVNDSRINAQRDVTKLLADFDSETREGYECLVDLASVGVSITKHKAAVVIQGFTYDMPTVERVGVGATA